MTIIRNDRRQRETLEVTSPQEAAADEEEVDYSWHPSDEEFPDPIPTERWYAMLSDPEVFDKDGLHAVECLDDYGGPVTFQQLSVKYRGTMGRYRKWLNGVAERAARHEGREPFGKDQYGQGEWWPYLYRQRIAGKAVANVHEMLLRPEVTEALRRRDEESSAKSKRQAQEAADAERARRAEQRRALLAAAEKAEAERKAREQREREEAEAQRSQQASRPSEVTAADEASQAPVSRPATSGRSNGKVAEGAAGPSSDDPLTTFLETMEGIEREHADTSSASEVTATPAGGSGWRPLDYAHRYADRLADVLELMAEGMPGLTVAGVARELGDESVAELQGYFNGEAIPSFAYIRRVCDTLFVDERRLEAPDTLAADLPAFATARERFGAEGAAQLVWGGGLKEVILVMDDSAERRGGVILRFSGLRCCLLERMPVSADADRYHDPALSAYVRLVRELDERAEQDGFSMRSLKIGSDDWDGLAAGLVWPGAVAARS